MKHPISYLLFKDNKEHKITITPTSQKFKDRDSLITGVYKLSEGKAALGNIVFDDQMKQWEYTAMGNLTHEDAAQIAVFIQINYTLIKK
ncbi:MAG: hypothetical protein V4560_14610 [Bacteroidota bacterium]